ncbi:MAG: hypothetical protein AB1529_08495 [Candidatus Micrarchaeota archaeon]
MPDEKKKDGAARRPREADSTLTFTLKDPKLEEIPFNAPPLRLYTLRQHLESYALERSSDPAGFNFDNFVRNVRGLKQVRLGGNVLDVLFTRSSAFITYSGTPEQMGAIPELSAIDMSKVSVASAPDGRTLTILRVSGKELRGVLNAPSGVAKKGYDGLLPPDGAEQVDLEELKSKLRGCSVVSSEDGFDLADFSRRVMLASVFRDEGDIPYLVIGLDGDELVYSAYVNASSQHSQANPMVCTLKYKDDTCVVFRVEVVG